MNHKMVISESDLITRFNNERDVVTLSPYHVVRCSSCRTIVKSEFVSDRCPVCGHSPFLPAPINASRNRSPVIETRSLITFLWLLLLSAAAALIPFAFPDTTEFIYKATFEVGFYYSIICVGAVSAIAALIIYNNRKGRKMWQNANGGGFLLLIPAGAPI